MPRRRPPFALGVDLGSARVRAALVERGAEGPVLVAVAARDVLDDDREAALRDAVAELATAERRCVLGLALPDARLEAIELPSMPARERRRAAAYEAARLGVATDARLVLAPLSSPERWALGAARPQALAFSSASARAARLRPIAVDDAALALRRAHPDADIIVDIGSIRTSVASYGHELPVVSVLSNGGDAFTAAIAHALNIGAAPAEQRKRLDGFAGAGEAQRDAFVAALVHELHARRSIGGSLRRLALTGNGSRVPGLAEALARAVDLDVRMAELPSQLAGRLPPDVLRAAGPDWGLAVGLALWEQTA
jgi:Tfp pilus assembly PilM family ATPase